MSGPEVLLGILVLGVVTYAFKVVGPLAAGRLVLPPTLDRAFAMLPTALVAGLVATQTFDDGSLDAKVLGVAAAALAVALRAPFAVVVLVGSVTAALLRAAGLP